MRLIRTYIFNQPFIVGVPMAALHGLDVAGKFRRIIIDKCRFSVHHEPLRSPLVPPSHSNDARACGKCVFPLKIERFAALSSQRGIRAGHIRCLCCGADANLSVVSVVILTRFIFMAQKAPFAGRQIFDKPPHFPYLRIRGRIFR